MSGSSMSAKKAPKGGFHQSDLNVHQAKMKEVLSELADFDHFPFLVETLTNVSLTIEKKIMKRRAKCSYFPSFRERRITTRSRGFVEKTCNSTSVVYYFYITHWIFDEKRWETILCGPGSYINIRNLYTEGEERDIGKGSIL